MGAVVHREDAVPESWPERDELAAESFSDAPDPVLEADPAADIDLADNVAWSVFDRRQCFGIGSGTHTIAIGRHRSKACWHWTRSAKLLRLSTSALSERWKRSSLPWVCG